MSIVKYQAFALAAEAGSFTKAAQSLGYTQSGVSHMISDLERQWGVSLLERSPGGVHLTSDGLRLLPYVRDVCEADSRLRSTLDEVRGLEQGIIRIGTVSSISTHWLPNMIKAFKVEYPAIEFEFLLGDYSEIERWALEGRVDCGFMRLPADPALESIFVEQDRLFVVLPPDHPLAQCDRFPLKALEDYPFMLLERSRKEDISLLLEEHGLKPRISFTTWDDYAIMAMVEGGLGISILPELILQRTPYRIVCKELEKPAYRQIGVVLKSRSTASLATRRFLAFLDHRNG